MDLGTCRGHCGPGCPVFDFSENKCYLRSALYAANLNESTFPAPTFIFPKSSNCSVPYACYTASVDSYPNGALIVQLDGVGLATCADACNADPTCAGFTYGAGTDVCSLRYSNANAVVPSSGYDHFFKTDCVPTSYATTLAEETTALDEACYNSVYSGGYFDFSGPFTTEPSFEVCAVISTAAGADNFVFDTGSGMCFVGPPLTDLGGFASYTGWLHVFRRSCVFPKTCFAVKRDKTIGGAGFSAGTFSGPRECGEVCEADAACVAFVFGGGACELKTQIATLTGDGSQDAYIREDCGEETTLSTEDFATTTTSELSTLIDGIVTTIATPLKSTVRQTTHSPTVSDGQHTSSIVSLLTSLTSQFAPTYLGLTTPQPQTARLTTTQHLPSNPATTNTPTSYQPHSTSTVINMMTTQSYSTHSPTKSTDVHNTTIGKLSTTSRTGNSSRNLSFFLSEIISSTPPSSSTNTGLSLLADSVSVVSNSFPYFTSHAAIKSTETRRETSPTSSIFTTPSKPQSSTEPTQILANTSTTNENYTLTYTLQSSSSTSSPVVTSLAGTVTSEMSVPFNDTHTVLISTSGSEHSATHIDGTTEGITTTEHVSTEHVGRTATQLPMTAPNLYFTTLVVTPTSRTTNLHSSTTASYSTLPKMTTTRIETTSSLLSSTDDKTSTKGVSSATKPTTATVYIVSTATADTTTKSSSVDPEMSSIGIFNVLTTDAHTSLIVTRTDEVPTVIERTTNLTSIDSSSSYNVISSTSPVVSPSIDKSSMKQTTSETSMKASTSQPTRKPSTSETAMNLITSEATTKWSTSETTMKPPTHTPSIIPVHTSTNIPVAHTSNSRTISVKLISSTLFKRNSLFSFSSTAKSTIKFAYSPNSFISRIFAGETTTQTTLTTPKWLSRTVKSSPIISSTANYAIYSSLLKKDSTSIGQTTDSTKQMATTAQISKYQFLISSTKSTLETSSVENTTQQDYATNNVVKNYTSKNLKFNITRPNSTPISKQSMATTALNANSSTKYPNHSSSLLTTDYANDATSLKNTAMKTDANVPTTEYNAPSSIGTSSGETSTLPLTITSSTTITTTMFSSNAPTSIFSTNIDISESSTEGETIHLKMTMSDTESSSMNIQHIESSTTTSTTQFNIVTTPTLEHETTDNSLTTNQTFATTLKTWSNNSSSSRQTRPTTYETYHSYTTLSVSGSTANPNLLKNETLLQLENIFSAKVPAEVLRAVAGGFPESLTNWLDLGGIRLSKANAIDVQNYTQGDLGKVLKMYTDASLPQDAVKYLEEFAGGKIPESVLDDIEEGLPESFSNWAELSIVNPSNEDLDKLIANSEQNGIPADLINTIIKFVAENTATTPSWKVAGQAAQELERLAGVPPGSIPADVLAAVDSGVPSAFVDWLDSAGLRTSKAQYRRLKASGELYNFPRPLSDAIAVWFNASWLQGAVNELRKFSGMDVPEPILDQMEEGDFDAYFAWMNESKVEPPPGRLIRLHARASGVEMPEAFIEAVDAWYERFGIVFTSSPPPTSPDTTERPLKPGETTTPPFPLSSEEAVAVSVMQSLGCAALIGILAGTLLLYAIVVRDSSIERCLHMNQELALLVGHTLILLMRDRTDKHVYCKLASVALQSLFLSNFAFLALEAFQAYTITSSVVGSGGVFNRKQFMAIGWLLPAAYSGGSALIMQSHYASFWSCWLNLGHAVALASLGPVIVLAGTQSPQWPFIIGHEGATVVMVEAGGMEAEREPQPDADQDQATAAMANQKGLLFVIPANVGSWFVGLYAVYSANVALYGLVFGLNLALAIAIFTFHTLGNPKVHGMMKRWLPCLR